MNPLHLYPKSLQLELVMLKYLGEQTLMTGFIPCPGKI
ncbi:hypothetical protein AM1_1708 [Acaryochloris marina MBIC11017]|uniref:Uncharacterized protein n=1 Tax=Acaryochloris marina (strain MBIC 11017) TaxID=329726 RepID=B0CB90_ACAM1|nr:hypothetical protein AM1_1708 [Acaryochloris marina MBIC11017]